jgi:hypothetical protein
LAYNPTRKLTIFALDPSVKDRHGILRTQLEIPNEVLEAGPRGYRAFIIDYDSTTDRMTRAAPVKPLFTKSGAPTDPFARASDRSLLNSRQFRCVMAYTIVMKTLSRFEFALGRRLAWSFGSHQIQVAPHAFSDANAFYSDHAQAIFFGYFSGTSGNNTVYTCLSHEIVAHETAHALLDGLRERYTDPSSPEQAGFHEGFADIVALLSVLSSQSIIERVVDLGLKPRGKSNIARSSVSVEALRNSGLFGLAQEMGSELAGIHGQALRRSIALKPGTDYLKTGEWDEPHRCGEILVAAVMNAFLTIWVSRLQAIGDETELDRARASEEGAELADHLLHVCIRAIDYCPPTDVEFGDFVSALITVDSELNPSDAKYQLRTNLLGAFKAYGIRPTSKGGGRRPAGAWDPPPEANQAAMIYDRTHFENMKSDPDELFRFLWENRDAFRMHDQAHTRVLSVRPCTRIGRDGFILRETVAEYHQSLKLYARELRGLGIAAPIDMPPDTLVPLYGGNAVIFDEYGHVKYNIGKSILDSERQTQRLAYLWAHGAFGAGASKDRSFARLHGMRSTDWFSAYPGVYTSDFQD